MGTTQHGSTDRPEMSQRAAEALADFILYDAQVRGIYLPTRASRIKRSVRNLSSPARVFGFLALCAVVLVPAVLWVLS